MNSIMIIGTYRVVLACSRFRVRVSSKRSLALRSSRFLPRCGLDLRASSTFSLRTFAASSSSWADDPSYDSELGTVLDGEAIGCWWGESNWWWWALLSNRWPLDTDATAFAAAAMAAWAATSWMWAMVALLLEWWWSDWRAEEVADKGDPRWAREEGKKILLWSRLEAEEGVRDRVVDSRSGWGWGLGWISSWWELWKLLFWLPLDECESLEIRAFFFPCLTASDELLLLLDGELLVFCFFISAAFSETSVLMTGSLAELEDGSEADGSEYPLALIWSKDCKASITLSLSLVISSILRDSLFAFVILWDQISCGRHSNNFRFWFYEYAVSVLGICCYFTECHLVETPNQLAFRSYVRDLFQNRAEPYV